MPFADYKWEHGKFGDDDIRTTEMFGVRVSICQKSRGVPGVTNKGMGVDRASTYFRIGDGPWIYSKARSMVETVNNLEIVTRCASVITSLMHKG